MSMHAIDNVRHALETLSIDKKTETSYTTASRREIETCELQGMDSVLDALRECIGWPMQYKEEGAILGVSWAQGVLVHGPSGVGKSASIQQVAREYDAEIHVVTPATLIGQYMGESEKNLREVFEKAEEQASHSEKPQIILIEEADSLFPQRKSGSSQQDARLVAQMLTLMDGSMAKSTRSTKNGHLVVIAVTTHPNSIDGALRRPGRLDKEIMIGVPDEDARCKILAELTRRMNVVQGFDVKRIGQRCHGYTGADLRSLCTAAIIHNLNKSQRSEELSEEDFGAAMQDVGASVARSVTDTFSPASWDDVGGLDHVKKLLQQYCVWPITRSNEFVKLGIRFPKGVLLHGPPGCAKTTLARAAVTSSGATFIPLVGTKLYSMYVGDGEAELRRAFTRARLSSPSILFIDEIDTLVGSRGHDDDHSVNVSTRLLTTFLTELDGIDDSSGVLIMGTTNRPFAIDSALLRPGRFDVHIYVPPPDYEGRLQTLEVHTKNVPLASDVSLRDIAQKTELYTGAELQAVCREATIIALRNNMQSASCVSQQDLLNALDCVTPSHTAHELQEYAQWPQHML